MLFADTIEGTNRIKRPLGRKLHNLGTTLEKGISLHLSSKGRSTWKRFCKRISNSKNIHMENVIQDLQQFEGQHCAFPIKISKT